MKTREEFSDGTPLLLEIRRRILIRAKEAFGEVISAYREIVAYRSLVTFYLKIFLRRKTARVLGFAVILVTVAELVGPVTHFPFFPHLGANIQAALGVVLLVCGIIGFRVHAIQSKANHEYALLLKSLHTLTGEIGDLDFSNPADAGERLLAYLQKTLAAFNVAFGQTERAEFSVHAGILVRKPNGDLQRFCQEPFTAYHPLGILPAGQGAGGCAARTGNMIYVPKVSRRHGIQIIEEKGPPPARILKLELNAFHYFDAGTPPFQSLLCVPLTVGSRTHNGSHAVLYVGSSRIGAFNNEFHINAAQLEASLIASVLAKFRTDSGVEELL